MKSLYLFASLLLFCSIKSQAVVTIQYGASQTTGSSGVCACSVSNASRAIGGDTTNYSTLNFTVGALAKLYQEITFSTAGLAGNYVGLIVKGGNGIVTASLLGGLKITTYDASGSVINVIDDASDGLIIKAMGPGTTVQKLEFISSGAVKKIRLELNSTLGVTTSFKIYEAYMTNAPLPITLINFDVSAKASQVVCNWATASESQSDYYSVERSADGSNYERIGTVKAAGNSTTIKNYQFVDFNPLYGLSYYRLRQLDTDGSQAIFLPKSVNRIKVPVSTTVYQSDDYIHIAFSGLIEGNKLEIKLYDLLGKLIYSSLSLYNGNDIKIDKKLERSLYVVSIASPPMDEKILKVALR